MKRIAAILLCAGYGTRLKPLTDSVPKPAIPFLGKPMVWYAMHAVKRAGIEAVAANVHHLPDEMSESLRKCARELGFENIGIYREASDILGTGGGARACLELLPDAQTFVIYHGDVLCGADLAKALDAHFTSGADVTMVVARRPEKSKLGMVGVDENHCVSRIRDWYRAGMDAQTAMMPCCFTGIHIVERQVLSALSLEKQACLVTEVYPSMMSANRRIHGCLIEDFFADVGTPETYLDAQQEILLHPEKLPGARVYPVTESCDYIVHPPISVSPGVRIPDGCEIGPNVCLSDEAEIKCHERLAQTMRFGHYKLPVPSGTQH